MVTITDRNLRHNVWETVYDTLKAFATAGSYGTTTQPQILAAYTESSDGGRFPEIIVYPINVNEGDRTFDNSSSLKKINVVIDIYAKKGEDIETLSDDVNYILDTKIAGLTLADTAESYAVPIVNDTKIKNKTISYNYIRR